jgi:probable F420-dependent oxidoreductase
MKVGVVVPMGTSKAPAPPRYAGARAYARQAEDAGFDSIWVFDHLLYRFPERDTDGVWEAWTFLSALAEATSRVELGTLVLSVPFRNPAVLAKMAVTLDEVSEGRVILGLGAGWHQPEFDAFGIPFDARAARFEEALQIIRPLLKEGRVTFEGKYHRAAEAEMIPRGPRPEGPPILIGAFGPRMLRLAARFADYWNTAWLGDADQLPERRAPLEAACRAEGRDPSTLAVTVGVGVDYSPPDRWGTGLARDRGMTGSPQEVAGRLRGFADAGVAHALCALTPPTPDSLARFSEALHVYREM